MGLRLLGCGCELLNLLLPLLDAAFHPATSALSAHGFRSLWHDRFGSFGSCVCVILGWRRGEARRDGGGKSGGGGEIKVGDATSWQMA